MSEGELIPYDLMAEPRIPIRVPPGWEGFRNVLPRAAPPRSTPMTAEELDAWTERLKEETLKLFGLHPWDIGLEPVPAWVLEGKRRSSAMHAEYHRRRRNRGRR